MSFNLYKIDIYDYFQAHNANILLVKFKNDNGTIWKKTDYDGDKKIHT